MAAARNRFLFHVEQIVDDQILHALLSLSADRGLPPPSVRPVMAASTPPLQLTPLEQPPPAQRPTVTALDFVCLYARERAGPFTVSEAIEVKPEHFTKGGITSALSVLKREKILKHVGRGTYQITAKGAKGAKGNTVKAVADGLGYDLKIKRRDGAETVVQAKGKRAPAGILQSAVLEALKGGPKKAHELREIANGLGASPNSIHGLLYRLHRERKEIVPTDDGGWKLKEGVSADA